MVGFFSEDVGGVDVHPCTSANYFYVIRSKSALQQFQFKESFPSGNEGSKALHEHDCAQNDVQIVFPSECKAKL